MLKMILINKLFGIIEVPLIYALLIILHYFEKIYNVVCQTKSFITNTVNSVTNLKEKKEIASDCAIKNIENNIDTIINKNEQLDADVMDLKNNLNKLLKPNYNSKEKDFSQWCSKIETDIHELKNICENRKKLNEIDSVQLSCKVDNVHKLYNKQIEDIKSGMKKYENQHKKLSNDFDYLKSDSNSTSNPIVESLRDKVYKQEEKIEKLEKALNCMTKEKENYGYNQLLKTRLSVSTELSNTDISDEEMSLNSLTSNSSDNLFLI
ncbi:hypothetical protein A3Q56_00230 [Intoshia linei]|uniref:Uncharacterized protein n=1 Tax=Intoshia linei TaxID=1819745 RepID=A0A177BEJ8_9BILA|nr:hypothetical protein A3Q56_00230 [Intoshia linei]